MTRYEALKIDFESNGFKNTVYPSLITDDKHMVLIDCGYPGFVPFLEKAISDKGLSLDTLTHVIITHHDFDHMGALKELKDRFPEVKVLASEGEAPFISGLKKSLRLVQAESIYETLPESAKPGAMAFQKMLEGVSHCSVDQIVTDGEVLDLCGGIKVIATPGHMPGHISLYHMATKAIAVGDAMVMEGEKLCVANPQYTLDMEMALSSIEKIGKLDVEMLVCYHGGVCRDHVKEAINELIEK